MNHEILKTKLEILAAMWASPVLGQDFTNQCVKVIRDLSITSDDLELFIRKNYQDYPSTSVYYAIRLLAYMCSAPHPLILEYKSNIVYDAYIEGCADSYNVLALLTLYKSCDLDKECKQAAYEYIEMILEQDESSTLMLFSYLFPHPNSENLGK